MTAYSRNTSIVHCIKARSLLPDPAALTPKWAAEPVLTLERRQKSLTSAGKRIPDYPARSVVINPFRISHTPDMNVMLLPIVTYLNWIIVINPRLIRQLIHHSSVYRLSFLEIPRHQLNVRLPDIFTRDGILILATLL